MIQLIFYIVAIIYMLMQMYFLWRSKKESAYYNGPKNTKAQQKIIEEQIKKLLETNPNHSFFDNNPEYKEKYLKEIDLSELNDVLKK